MRAPHSLFGLQVCQTIEELASVAARCAAGEVLDPFGKFCLTVLFVKRALQMCFLCFFKGASKHDASCPSRLGDTLKSWLCHGRSWWKWHRRLESNCNSLQRSNGRFSEWSLLDTCQGRNRTLTTGTLSRDDCSHGPIGPKIDSGCFLCIMYACRSSLFATDIYLIAKGKQKPVCK